MYGLLICLAGLFNFSQYGLDYLTHVVFNHNPLPADVILTAIAFVVGSALVVYVWRKMSVLDRESLAAEAEQAPEVAMPDLTES